MRKGNPPDTKVLDYGPGRELCTENLNADNSSYRDDKAHTPIFKFNKRLCFFLFVILHESTFFGDQVDVARQS